ncbi:DUF305 domain-containing protein [Nonomuraea phyllanthi]|uniref:DUF305 domain-containing protein n=1 Tax=Nonomuraea phyllanthi TaxID=2219224 RepID=A0A5C4VK72_9ACTN|nr:DUF305 domain-containing protein [Nonomuraea phyllanthi]KAB8189186.1 DUF305 domain-containing protein [Nonomuraea phyllanthi]
MSSAEPTGPSARHGHRGGRTAPRAVAGRAPWVRTRLAPLVLLALAAVLVGGYLARDDTAVRHAHHAPAEAAGPRAAQPVPSGSVNPTDLAWLQLMIPMDERVLPLLDLGASRGHAPAVRRLARRLRTTYVVELAHLRAALHTTGLPADNPHAGHDMPGMVTAVELTRLRTAEGPAFDTLFTGHLRAHLSQSQSVTRSEQVSGADPGVKALAAAVERARANQLSALRSVERSPS